MQSKLIKLRKVYNFSQSDLANLLNINLRTYQNKELSKSRFTADEMFILRKIFKKPMEDIFLPTKKIEAPVYQTKEQKSNDNK